MSPRLDAYRPLTAFTTRVVHGIYYGAASILVGMAAASYAGARDGAARHTTHVGVAMAVISLLLGPAAAVAAGWIVVRAFRNLHALDRGGVWKSAVPTWMLVVPGAQLLVPFALAAELAWQSQAAWKPHERRPIRVIDVAAPLAGLLAVAVTVVIPLFHSRYEDGSRTFVGDYWYALWLAAGLVVFAVGLAGLYLNDLSQHQDATASYLRQVAANDDRDWSPVAEELPSRAIPALALLASIAGALWVGTGRTVSERIRERVTGLEWDTRVALALPEHRLDCPAGTKQVTHPAEAVRQCEDAAGGREGPAFAFSSKPFRIVARRQYASGRLDGASEELDAEGKVVCHVTWRADAKHGPSRCLVDGLVREGGYADGKASGGWTTRTPAGAVVLRETFVAGVLEGPWEKRTADGKLVESGAYAAGVRSGIWKSYDDAGRLEREGPYDGGRMTGLWTSYDPTGWATSRATFVDGKREGIEELLHVDGHVTESRVWVHDVLEGPFTRFHSGGAQAATGTYAKGKLEGLLTEQWPDGKLHRKASYAEGKLHGKWEEYDEQGVLAESGQYTNGYKHGQWMKYWPNGRPKREENLVFVQPLDPYQSIAAIVDGPYRTWFEDGRRQSEQVFARGQEISYRQWDERGVEVSVAR